MTFCQRPYNRGVFVSETALFKSVSLFVAAGPGCDAGQCSVELYLNFFVLIVTPGPACLFTEDDEADMSAKFNEYYGEIERIRIEEGGEPTTKRPAEVEAVRAIVQPSLPEARTVEQHRLDMLREGRVECVRCRIYKHHTEFGKDDRNPDRLDTKVYCLQCDSERTQIKRQVQRTGRRSETYQYHARQKKGKKRRR